MEQRCPHVLVLAFPTQGHIAPMLTFSHLLDARGVVVTFLNTEKAHARILLSSSSEEAKHAEGQVQKKSLGIRFEVMPDGSQEPLPGSQPSFDINNMLNILKDMESNQGFIEEMVVSSRATAHPITCIISDCFFPWTCTLATKLGIQRVSFWTSNGVPLWPLLWSSRVASKLKFSGSGNHKGDSSVSFYKEESTQVFQCCVTQ